MKKQIWIRVLVFLSGIMPVSSSNTVVRMASETDVDVSLINSPLSLALLLNKFEI